MATKNYHANAAIYLSIDPNRINNEKLLEKGFNRSYLRNGGIQLEYDGAVILLQGSVVDDWEVVAPISITAKNENSIPQVVSKLEELTGHKVREIKK